MPALRVLVCVCALALLSAARAQPTAPAPAPAAEPRCGYDASGDLAGSTLRKKILLPPGRMVYNQELSPPKDCKVIGVSARACDVFAAQLLIASDFSAVEVRRLGPRHQPIELGVGFYCDTLARSGGPVLL